MVCFDNFFFLLGGCFSHFSHFDSSSHFKNFEDNKHFNVEKEVRALAKHAKIAKWELLETLKIACLLNTTLRMHT